MGVNGFDDMANAFKGRSAHILHHTSLEEKEEKKEKEGEKRGKEGAHGEDGARRRGRRRQRVMGIKRGQRRRTGKRRMVRGKCMKKKSKEKEEEEEEEEKWGLTCSRKKCSSRWCDPG